jgi:hypothetical protein
MKGFTRSCAPLQGSGGTRVFPGLQGSGSRLTISIMRRDLWQRELKNRMWQGLSHIGRSGRCSCCGSHMLPSTLAVLIPMHYTDRASSLAGFLDFCSYVGAGIMSLVTGITLQLWSWNEVLVVFVLLNAVGAALMGTRRLRLGRLE